MVDLSRTIPDVLIKASKQWADQIAIEDGDYQLSYIDLEQRAREIAAAFIAHDFKPGETFSIWAPNIHEWIWTAIGGQMAGGILVPLNTRYKGIEASDILTRSGARLLFTVSGFLDTDYPDMLANQTLPDLEKIILLRGESEIHQSISSFIDDGAKISDGLLTKG